MGFPESFATPRLRAQRLAASDLDELAALLADPRVMATLGGVRSQDEARRVLDASEEQWRRHGHGLCAFRAASDGSFVGRAGLRRISIEGREETELLYAVRAECWRRGLATEMARGLLAHAAAHLEPESVVAFTLLDNEGSRRVMEKCGMSFERAFAYAGRPHVLYRWRPI